PSSRRRACRDGASPSSSATTCCRASTNCWRRARHSPTSTPASRWRPCATASSVPTPTSAVNRLSVPCGRGPILSSPAASPTLGPAVHEFGLAADDWDRLAAGTVAGHLIECGAQATGGLWCNWQETDLALVGYPIADIEASGAFTLTKPPGSGGAVNRETV